MAFDPVTQWERIVAAWNDRDWATCEALYADDFDEVLVLGAVHKPAPTMRYDKAEYLPTLKRMAARLD
jgi:hypothetical protein